MEGAEEGTEVPDGEGGAEEGGGEGQEGSSVAGAEVEAVDEGSAEVPPSRPVKKVANQFNFCDRAALTYNNPYRVSVGLGAVTRDPADPDRPAADLSSRPADAQHPDGAPASGHVLGAGHAVDHLRRLPEGLGGEASRPGEGSEGTSRVWSLVTGHWSLVT